MYIGKRVDSPIGKDGIGDEVFESAVQTDFVVNVRTVVSSAAPLLHFYNDYVTKINKNNDLFVFFIIKIKDIMLHQLNRSTL